MHIEFVFLFIRLPWANVGPTTCRVFTLKGDIALQSCLIHVYKAYVMHIFIIHRTSDPSFILYPYIDM